MDTKQFLNYPVYALFGVPEQEGNKIGIELELEGRNVGLQDVATRGWGRHMDGSLRGEAIEYITNGAKEVPAAKSLVKDLFAKFKEHGVKFNDSIRTSTHVHLNFSDKPVKQAVNFFLLFTMLEEVLQYYSGEDRKGNLFCISTREAEGIVGVLSSGLGKGDLSAFAGDRYKYAACNLSTLYKFGTVEVRTMRGANSAEQVNKWIDILNDLYKYSLEKMRSPVDLITRLSLLGAEALMREIFAPDNYRELIGSFPAIRTLHHSLMEGARIFQIMAYEFEEAFLVETDFKDQVKNQLFVRMKDGPFKGHLYTIYRPDGQHWNVSSRTGLPFWRDGDQVADDFRITWSQARQRFVMEIDGEIVECRWQRHHEIPDEGPPAMPVALPGNRRAERGRGGRLPPHALFVGRDDDDEDDDDEGEGGWDFEPELEDDEG
jgi:hypothetical protein